MDHVDRTKTQSSQVEVMTPSPHPTVVEIDDNVYDDGYLRVEHKNYYVACGGSPLKLPRTEFLIFSRLARTPNRIVPASDLWASVWGPDKPLNSESLHVYIYRLRIKLGSFGLQIDTMVNVGYRLITASAR